ncbi:uncharacterized protein [Periplaneta americana]|uniref:uncharacterized protein isoform X5 n=1 Tax=Periplaneta americana TaxID=6978 RepID=UPI0037E7365B
MDLIKTEPKVDPLTIRTSHDRDVEDMKPLSEEGNSLDPHITGVKMECLEDSYVLSSEIKLEENIFPINFPVVKCETEENSCDVDILKKEVNMKIKAEEEERYL